MGLHDYYYKLYFHKWVFHFCLVCFTLDTALQIHLFWLPDFLFNASIVFYCWYCPLSRGLVIKYLRVITSSRLCGDNPANFALLHTIAYNCQSSSFNDVLVPGCSLFSELFRSRGPFVLPFIGSSVCPPARISSPSSVASPLVTPVTPVVVVVFYHLEGLDSCKWSSKGPVSCKWSSGGDSLLQMIIQRAAALRGVIGDSRSCMKIAFLLWNIRFRTHTIIILDQKNTKKNHKKLPVLDC